MKQSEDLLPMALTMGDPAGIGPEIIFKAFAAHPDEMRGICVAGNLTVMRRQLAALLPHLPQAIQCQEVTVAAAALQVPHGCVPVINVTPDAEIEPGRVSAAAGRMAADAVSWGAGAALRAEVSALVNAPLHKKALSLAGVEFPGHTEMLQALAAEHLGLAAADLPVRMMLSCRGLRVVLVSIHVSLRQAIDAVTTANVLETLQIIHRSWPALHGRHPRIWVAGLNPHAGEEGLFGAEEIQLIAPAIARAKTAGMQVEGPFAPDTVFMQARRAAGPNAPDAVVAMYHDQGLIPVKLLGIEHGVNQTLGLPFVRTSPDHGTAFDIAGQARADARSLLAAVRAARSCKLSGLGDA
ncbi:MAG: 4-hydroxythreonine-4-phosphate dehydrogenase PdxA [Limnohabitans sp.]|nr:4-hydroxythreonine-4-phosphate dehydrogenase PdxA [Limnohabitans sp.]